MNKTNCGLEASKRTLQDEHNDLYAKLEGAHLTKGELAERRKLTKTITTANTDVTKTITTLLAKQHEAVLLTVQEVSEEVTNLGVRVEKIGARFLEVERE